jgi:molybdopterin adenylyltransferase
MEKLRVIVITASDRSYRGERSDLSGPTLVDLLKNKDFEVIESIILPDEKNVIFEELVRISDGYKAHLVLTTGGTGFSKRDVTPEATLEAVERVVPGIPEAMRYHSMKITPKGMLSRAAAGIRKETLIVNFPGSPKACSEIFDYVIDPIIHGINILIGADGDCAQK